LKFNSGDDQAVDAEGGHVVESGNFT